MDPNACLQRLIGALAMGAEIDARHTYTDLDEWIRRGGFWPHAFADAELVAAYRRGYAIFARALMDKYVP